MSVKVEIVFTGVTGLNNISPITHFEPDTKTGYIDLASIINFKIGDYNDLVSVPGFTNLQAGVAHSLFSCGDYGYVVIDGDLYFINALGIFNTGVSPGDIPVSYARVQDKIFFCNGLVQGIMVEGDYVPWTAPTEVDARYPDRYLSAPPIGRLVAYYRGRLYVAVDDGVFVSEPFNYFKFDMEKGYIPLKHVQAILPVNKGIYFATEFEVQWADFIDYEKIQLMPVLNGRIVSGSQSKVNTDRLTHLITSSMGVNYVAQGDAWVAVVGGYLYFLADDFVLNLTQNKVVLPPALSGGGASHNGFYYASLNE